MLPQLKRINILDGSAALASVSGGERCSQVLRQEPDLPEVEGFRLHEYRLQSEPFGESHERWQRLI